MKTMQEDYNAYQPYMLLDFSFSFENDIAHDDICRSIIKIVKGINLGKFINFDSRNSYGYDGTMMFTLVILAKTLFGYASTRTLEELCKTNVSFMTIAQNQKISHQSFQRFIHDDLIIPIENISFEINKYIEFHIVIRLLRYY